MRNGIPMKDVFFVENDRGETMRGERRIDLALEPRAPSIMGEERVIHRHKVNVRWLACERTDVTVKRNPHIAGHFSKCGDKVIPGLALTSTREKHFFSERIIREGKK